MERKKTKKKPKLPKSTPIKSTAVVKYSAVGQIAQFSKLDCNTDLNLPPSNWLNNISASYGLQHTLPVFNMFSSFSMAYRFIDSLRNVDVVSDAKNIKSLLKLPYNRRGTVNLMVHRVQNTLLIDEVDINKLILEANEWTWLKTFYKNYVLKATKDLKLNLRTKDKSREALQQRSLYSKFLCRSISNLNDENCKKFAGVAKNEEEENSSASTCDGPLIPEPGSEEDIPYVNPDYNFKRNIVWSFEDIQMLIGSDMPIFGGTTHPCVSLRLRDMKKPINVLTGIDYWLDNLMCNVPDVMMCYHIDGIVQKYEMLRTEDLPKMQGSEFSPSIIRNVAQNILSFLKKNATKAGHTYWLFKGKDDDVVKLYDLTNLCPHTPGTEHQDNPFTIPVAMLLYRVARNMKQFSKKPTASEAGTIRMLLLNCIKLLPVAKYPHIVTATHYMLVDLYLPPVTDMDKFPSMDHANWHESKETKFETFSDSDSDSSEKPFVSLNIQEMTDQKNDKPDNDKSVPPPPLRMSLEERCVSALYHIAQGLQSIRSLKKGKKKRKNKQEPGPNMNKSAVIPMPYDNGTPANVKQLAKYWEKEAKAKDRLRVQNEQLEALNSIDELRQKLTSPVSVLMREECIPDSEFSLAEHFRMLFCEKACLIYTLLVEKAYSSEMYGMALQYAQLGVMCHSVVKKQYPALVRPHNVLFTRAGDCYYRMSQSTVHANNAFKTWKLGLLHNGEAILTEVLKTFKPEEEWQFIPEPESAEKEKCMLTACRMYDLAYKEAIGKSRQEIIKRIAYIKNELGCCYMFWSENELYELKVKSKSNPRTPKKETKCLRMADLCFKFLNESLTEFYKMDDTVNACLVLSNLARYHRFRPFLCSTEFTPNFSEYHYIEAYECYATAIQCLQAPETNQFIWSSAIHDIGTAMGVYAQGIKTRNWEPRDINTLENIKKESLTAFRTAFNAYSNDKDLRNQFVYSFKKAVVLIRMGVLYCEMLEFEKHKKNVRRQILCYKMAKAYFIKARDKFASLGETNGSIIASLELSNLYQYLGTLGDFAKEYRLYCLYNSLISLLNLEESMPDFERISNGAEQSYSFFPSTGDLTVENNQYCSFKALISALHIQDCVPELEDKYMCYSNKDFTSNTLQITIRKSLDKDNTLMLLLKPRYVGKTSVEGNQEITIFTLLKKHIQDICRCFATFYKRQELFNAEKSFFMELYRISLSADRNNNGDVVMKVLKMISDIIQAFNNAPEEVKHYIECLQALPAFVK